MFLSPSRKKSKIVSPAADTVENTVVDTVSDRPPSAKKTAKKMAKKRKTERVNPVFGAGYPTKFDNFSILPRIVREAVYSCVDWDTSRALPVALPETKEYYKRKPYAMKTVTLRYSPDSSYLPFTDNSDFVVDYHGDRDLSKRSHEAEIHAIGLQEHDWVPGFRSRFVYEQLKMPDGCDPDVNIARGPNFLMHCHKRSFVPRFIFTNFRHIRAAQFCVHAISFFGDTPAGLQPLRHCAQWLCLVFEDADLDLVNNMTGVPRRSNLRCRGARLNVNMGEHPELVVNGTRDWLRFVRPSVRFEMSIGYAMTVPSGVFDLYGVQYAAEVIIQQHENVDAEINLLDETKIDITIAQLRALDADTIHFAFETPSISVDELYSFVMDKIKAWLAERDPLERCHFLFYNPTVVESDELRFLSELNKLVVGDRFKVHSVDTGVWIDGAYTLALRGSILEDTELHRHLLVRCGAEDAVSIRALYPCEGHSDCHCVIGLGPCKAAE